MGGSGQGKNVYPKRTTDRDNLHALATISPESPPASVRYIVAT
jgi:hypothetical protein